MTGLENPAKEIIFEAGVANAFSGVIIGHSHVALGVKGQAIDATSLNPVGEPFDVESMPHIRAVRHGMVVIEQRIFWLMHVGSLTAGKANKTSRYLIPALLQSQHFAHQYGALLFSRSFRCKDQAHGFIGVASRSFRAFSCAYTTDDVQRLVEGVMDVAK